MINKVFNLIKDQFEELMSNDYEYYREFNLKLTNEQFFVKDKQREKDTIYIVVKFMPATIDFGQTLLPVTFNAVSERNGIEVCQKLMFEYAQIYNLKTINNDTGDFIQQRYSTPSVMSNFNDIYDGFRSLFYMSGSFLISENVNSWDLYYYDSLEAIEGIKIEILNMAVGFDNNLDSQPYVENGNFVESISKFGSLSFNLTTYLIDNQLMNKCIDIMAKKSPTNTSFYFEIVFKKSNLKIPKAKYKLQNSSLAQTIGEIPAITLSFSN